MKMPVEKRDCNKLLSCSKFCGSYGKVIFSTLPWNEKITIFIWVVAKVKHL